MPDPCEHYLKVKHDCESYVECVLRSKGFKIVAVDQHGYDIEAYYPSGVYYYFIEVKCGPRAKLSTAVVGLSLKYRPVIKVKSNNCCTSVFQLRLDMARSSGG